MNSFFVYILLCADNSYYVGHTDDLDKRIAQHNNKEGGTFTSKRLPVQVVFSQAFATRDEALGAERQIKGWNRAKKQALIQSNWNLINKLSKKHFKVNRS